MKDGYCIMVYESESYPQYKWTEKDVTINNRKHKAIFVKKHSAISAMIYQWRNVNADDPWANTKNYQLTFYIKYKGQRKWTLISQNDFVSQYGSNSLNPGYLEILFNLETSAFKNEYRKNAKIAELKSKIQEYTEELLNLTEGE